jgi:hypothetical protein
MIAAVGGFNIIEIILSIAWRKLWKIIPGPHPVYSDSVKYKESAYHRPFIPESLLPVFGVNSSGILTGR